jgi:DNA-binding IclR family transcriptional regulator
MSEFGEDASLHKERGLVASVLKAIRLMELFEPGRPELTLAEFVERGGYSKTTTYRLLTTLETGGWLQRTDRGTFRLTIRPFQIGAILIDSLELREEAAPEMTRLSEKLDVSCYLFVAAGPHAVCVEQVLSRAGMNFMDLGFGGSQPLHIGAAPRVLLAFNEDRLMPDLLRLGLTARTRHTIVDPDRLRTDLATIRRRGYSVADQDATVGAAAVGAPVFDASGRAVAAISLGGSCEDIMERVPQLAERLQKACTVISDRLGYRPPSEKGDAMEKM